MKIVQINAVCNYGSTGRTTLELSKYLTNNNIENYVFYGNGYSDYPPAKRLNTDFGVKLHGLMSRLMGRQGYFSFLHTQKIIKELKTINPDIVHLRNLHGNFIHLNMLLKYLGKNKIATVISLHDCWFYTGHCTHYITENCEKWKTGCYNCPRKKNDNPSWFFDQSKSVWKDRVKYFGKINKLGVIGVSDWVTNEAKQSFLSKNAKFKRIYNWIDTSVFYPRNNKDEICEKYNLPKEKYKVILVAGRWNKGSEKYNDLKELLKLIDNDVQVILVGGYNSDEYLGENVSLVGYINNTNELAELYSVADVYVHLSHADTFGKVVAEALACGTPAIVYNTTALPELVNKECGYVAPCGDTQAVFDALNKIKKNGKSFYSKSCADFASENFEKETLIESTLDFYSVLLNN